MVYICAKFREIIWNGIKVMERTRYQSYGADTNVQPLTDGRTDRRTDTQKFGGYNIIPRHFLWRGIKTLFHVRFVSITYLLFKLCSSPDHNLRARFEKRENL